MPTQAWTRAGILRPIVGVGISIAFGALTLARIDLAVLAEASYELGVASLVVAAGLSLFEVCVRALRSVILITPLSHIGFPAALGFLAFGHLANALLPARLGDIARAMVAGGRLRISRASVLGTIAVERVADAAVLALALSGGIIIGYSYAAVPLITLVAVGAAGAVVVGLAALWFRRFDWSSSRIGIEVHRLARRFVQGATALRDPSGAARVLGLTVASFALASGIMHAAATAAGLDLAVWQSALVIAAVTLSTAIPAGPASLGTYEFVGVSVLSSMGYPPEAALLAVGAVHIIATTVPALMGLAAMWRMGVGVRGWMPTTAARGSHPRQVSG